MSRRASELPGKAFGVCASFRSEVSASGFSFAGLSGQRYVEQKRRRRCIDNPTTTMATVAARRKPRRKTMTSCSPKAALTDKEEGPWVCTLGRSSPVVSGQRRPRHLTQRSLWTFGGGGAVARHNIAPQSTEHGHRLDIRRRSSAVIVSINTSERRE